MIIQPMIRNNICMNAHPAGCALNVARQIEYVKQKGQFAGPKRVLIIGSSGGYGLASLIAASYGSNADTVGVAFETPARGTRTASAGWYNNAAFEHAAKQDGKTHRTFIADAFSHETRTQVAAYIQETMGSVDMVIYSLASGMRKDPDTETVYRSVLKPIGQKYESVTLDVKTASLVPSSVEPANEDEIAATVKVMGGEDWHLWMKFLSEAGVLADHAVTVAYSYIGPQITFPLYRDGTIGRAKIHLEKTVESLNTVMKSCGGRAYVSVNKALVTRASSVIPAVPLYLAMLYKVMKQKGIHEGTIEQIYRLFTTKLYTNELPELDAEGRIRIDDWEMRDDVQMEIREKWKKVTADNFAEFSDVEGFQEDFLQVHGFGFDSIDYTEEVDV